MRVLELRGLKSLRALHAFHTLMLGLKMLPAYITESYEDFYGRVAEMDAASQEKLIREAALFVPLQRDEVEGLLSFCADPNGVPYTIENAKNLGPKELHEAIVAVAKEVAKIKIDMIGEAEKKN